MTKQTTNCTKRRFLLSLLIFILFLIYLAFDIDFLIAFKIDNDDIDIFEQPEIVINPFHHPPIIQDIDIDDNDDYHNSIDQSSLSLQINDMMNTNINKSKSWKNRNSMELIEIFEQYGFDKEGWDYFNLSNDHCPYFENICIHKNHFYVHEKKDQFKLNSELIDQDLFGNGMKNSNQSFEIYKQVFNSRIWNETMNEYQNSNCLLEQTSNHIILSSHFMSIMNEFFVKVLTGLNWLFEMNLLDSTKRDYKFYLMLPEFHKILVDHRLFMERFTKWDIQQFVDLFEHYRCKCYHRLFFCGFQQITINDNLSLIPKKSLLQDSNYFIPYLRNMINEYQLFINKHHINIKQDLIKWKQEKLDLYFNGPISYINKYGKMKQRKENKIINDETDASKWKFIGLYQTTNKRKWKNMRESIRLCNDKYNKQKIICIEINLKDFHHTMDIILIHRALLVLVGIHGAPLINGGVLMEQNVDNYIIELLPYKFNKSTTICSMLFLSIKYNNFCIPLQSHSNYRVDTDILLNKIDLLL